MAIQKTELPFSKDKYLQIMKTDGAGAALTQLQKDIVSWEIESFEGPQGYQPEMFDSINIAREFARELWDQAVDQ